MPASILAGLRARIRSLWRGARRRADVEAEMAEEFRHHLELRTEDLVRSGIPPEQAARQARLEFGHIPHHKADARASRGLRLLDELGFSWLDVKLGARMLARYPGLTLVSVIGIAVATAVGAAAFGGLDAVADPSLPLHEDERIVSLVNADLRDAGETEQKSLHDFVYWRGTLRSVQDLAAFTGARRNLILADGTTEPVRIARMTASGFRVARVAPILGRPLQDADERPGAPPVVVIAHDEWRRVFAGDPGVIGQRVRIGGEAHTIVGVMPDGFRFPVSHRYWVPLRLDPAEHPIGQGPELFVFGRLADGVTMADAQAELTVLGQRMAAEHPATNAHLRPQVLPYTYPFLDLNSPGMLWMLRGLVLAVALLLVLVSVNVAILIYARTATRSGEIAVRSALGASRRRIVTQFFAEAFVLSALASAIGLAVATFGLEAMQRQLDQATGNELPFWLDLGLSTSLVAYVAGLAVVAAVIVGVVPALKATGRDIQAGLQRLGSRGSQMHLGRTWTALIVTQVAIAVAALPFALHLAGSAVERATAAPIYAAEEFLQAALWYEPEAVVASDTAIAPSGSGSGVAVADADAGVDAGTAATRRRFASSATVLLQRLAAEPEVAGVTFASGFPANDGLGKAEIEVEGMAARSIVRVNRVDAGFLGVLGVRPTAGRALSTTDAGANTVVVDELFAAALLPGRSAVGRRIRYVKRAASGEIQPGPWVEIAGVVPMVNAQDDVDPAEPTLYEPVTVEQFDGSLIVRVRSGVTPSSVMPRLRRIAAAVDPALHLDELRTTVDVDRERRQWLIVLALGVVVVTGSVLLLSAAGMYAMMSFTVARRRREIGIRSALGADPRRLLRSIFARATAQIGGGVAVGLALAFVVDRLAGGSLSREAVVLVPSVAALMLLIGVSAAAVPARRGLAIEPTEALREE